MFGLDGITCVCVVVALVAIGLVLLFAGAKKINGPS
jgi:hypothetical protein